MPERRALTAGEPRVCCGGPLRSPMTRHAALTRRDGRWLVRLARPPLALSQPVVAGLGQPTMQIEARGLDRFVADVRHGMQWRSVRTRNSKTSFSRSPEYNARDMSVAVRRDRREPARTLPTSRCFAIRQI